MDQGLIPRRYAKALFKAGAERKVNSSLYDIMKALVAAFAAQPGLQEAVANPFVPAADKTALLTGAVRGASDNKGALATYGDFLALLAENKRVDMARNIANAFVDLYRKENHIAKVEVVSAAPLDPALEQRLKGIIGKHLNGGTMEYSSRVDPDLIGGFVVNVDSERLDASVRNELKQLRLNLIS